jgi:transposase
MRAVSGEERTALSRLSRSRGAPAAQAARARALLAVADGQSYTTAARLVGRRTGDTVARWVARFNEDGLSAVAPRHGGGHRIRYGEAEQRRILAEVARPPDRARDGTATWSLTTLRAALRRAEDGLPGVSTTRSAAPCTPPASVGRRAAPGARPAWSCASAAARWRSAIPMRWGKNADRAGIHVRCRARLGGLVRGRGRPLSSRAAPRPQLAAAE